MYVTILHCPLMQLTLHSKSRDAWLELHLTPSFMTPQFHPILCSTCLQPPQRPPHEPRSPRSRCCDILTSHPPSAQPANERVSWEQYTVVLQRPKVQTVEVDENR